LPNLPLTLACWDYDRTAALADGRVRIDGVDLTYLTLRVEETFLRMIAHREFDIAEMSLSSYTMSKFRDDAFVALPVFPSRVFRHASIYVTGASGIREPKDLIGKRVGVPEYQMTAAVWIRGILADEYGVPVPSVSYFTGGEEQPGRAEKPGLRLPPEIKVQPIPTDRSLSEMLGSGELDALYTAQAPSTLGKNGLVHRLFDDYVAAEQAYYRRTQLFPIMHTIVLRRELYERHRWLAVEVYKAFVRAQAIAYENLRHTGVTKTMLPWMPAYAEATRALMGEDFWPYGLEKNQKTLETFLRYHYEQGLAPRRLEPHDLFAPETLESYKI
jgi:4,5-dihydroxyphthalate decarboxylase